jgi:hypothetical protein
MARSGAPITLIIPRRASSSPRSELHVISRNSSLITGKLEFFKCRFSSALSFFDANFYPR